MSTLKTPRQKKRASLRRDCRYDYGNSPHAARKSVPRNRAIRLQQVRRGAKQRLARAGIEANAATPDAATLDALEHDARAYAQLKLRRGFRKSSDAPLGEILRRRREWQSGG